MMTVPGSDSTPESGVPSKAGTDAVTKKGPAKKNPAKKAAAKKNPAKKSPAKKSPAKKSPAQKSPAKKRPAKKNPAKKSPAGSSNDSAPDVDPAPDAASAQHDDRPDDSHNPWAMPFGLGGLGGPAPEMPELPDLGEFIRNQREAARLSVRRLAELANVSNPYLSQVERGLRKPSADILQQVANALRISVESLYVRAGILPDPGEERVSSVPEAIDRDPRLTDEQKTALRGVYDSFVSD